MKKSIVRDALNIFTREVGIRFFINTDDLSVKFSGDTLTVAEVFKQKITKELDRYDGVICGMTIHNARVHTFRALTKPAIKDSVNPCHRCDGTGFMPFKHIKGGTCFKCNGTGSSRK